MLSFPTIAFRENRIILSKEELERRVKEARQVGKSCEVGIYAFREWMNSKPIKESAIIDKIVLTGKREVLEEYGRKQANLGKECMLIFDGKSYLLFVRDYLSLEELERYTMKDLKVIKNPFYKIVIPGCENLRTGKKSVILKWWNKK